MRSDKTYLRFAAFVLCMVTVGIIVPGPAESKAPAPVQAEQPKTQALPEYGLCVGGTIQRIKDGDTLVFQPDPITVDVRLLDCWAPEVHGDEKPEGLKSKANLEKLAGGRHARLFVPASRRVSDWSTLSRIKGKVWVDGETVDLSTRQVKEGFATSQKQKTKPISKEGQGANSPQPDPPGLRNPKWETVPDRPFNLIDPKTLAFIPSCAEPPASSEYAPAAA